MRIYLVSTDISSWYFRGECGAFMRVYLSSSVGATEPQSNGRHIGRDNRAMGEAVRAYIVSASGSPTANNSPKAVGEAMRIYLGEADGAGGRDRRAAGAARVRHLRVLLSYHYFKEHDLDELVAECFGGIDELDLFCDSGAFSAFTGGGSVDLGAYIEWVQRWKHRFSAVCGLDVIGDAAATKRGAERMRREVTGVPVLPVFHVGEPWEFLDEWCACEDVDYIALGGMVPYTRRLKLLTAWLDKAWSKIPRRVRVHGFGLTTWPLLLRYPWYSVDSSSWTSGVRFATLSLFDERRGRFLSIDMRDRRALLGAAALLERYGIRPSEMRASGYDRDRLVAASVLSWQQAEAWLTRRREEIDHGEAQARAK